MVRHLSGAFECAAVVQIGRDTRGAKGVVADARGDAAGFWAPLAVSQNTFSAPAARSCFTCASTLWPSVETRA